MFESHSESSDSELVDNAVEQLMQGAKREAESTLLAVSGRAPEKYVYEYREDRTRFIKFWSREEFLQYVSWEKQQGASDVITWVRSAYPRAFYYLGFLYIDEGQIEKAIAYLDRGAAMEPTNPNFAIERAQALIKLKRYQEALSLFSGISEPGPHVTYGDVALALRGKGFILIEMGELDKAVEAYQESQKIEPKNTLAQSQLKYIEHLRRGGCALPPKLMQSNSAQKA